MIVKLEASGLILEAEDDVAGFIAVLIERRGDGTILMTQPGLTQRIGKALKIDHLSPKRTPTKHGALGKDEEVEAAHGEYSYPSMIGIIGYLEGHSRNDTTSLRILVRRSIIPCVALYLIYVLCLWFVYQKLYSVFVVTIWCAVVTLLKAMLKESHVIERKTYGDHFSFSDK
jgi:hypothetical protein